MKRLWLRTGEQDSLSVSMAGIRLGNRLLVVGAADAPLLAGAAAKTGLTGRACVVDSDPARTESAVAAAEREGALVEGFTAPCTSLPFQSGVFDVAIVRNVLPGLSDAQRVACMMEVQRVLRPGGRGMVIDGIERTGLAAVFNRRSGDDAAVQVLTTAGFRAVRILAERHGLLFVEGVRASS